MSKFRHTRLPRHQQGFSLLEVLIAVLILAFGLLGVAALQVRSLQGTQSSNYRSNAAVLTQEIVDAIRANRSRAEEYSVGLGRDIPSASGTAGTDLANWRRRIIQQLPDGRSSIQVERTATPPPPDPSGAPALPASLSVRLTVTILWSDARWLATDTGGETTVITVTEI